MDGINFIKHGLNEGMRNAAEWVFDAIDAVRSAPGGDKLGDDEAIAGQILKQMEAKK